MPLKAVKPESRIKRFKAFVYAAPGMGKTTFASQFPKSYFFDLEHGTDNYSESLSKAGSSVLHTTSPDEISEQLHALLTEKHDFLTCVIDPETILYQSVQDKWTRLFTQYAGGKAGDLQDFGPRYWGRVKSEMKSIQRKLLSLDMNVIVTSHQKDVYGQSMNKLGVSFDSMKGIDYIFDYIFRLEKSSDGKRIAITEKERAEVGKNKFPVSFEWSYENFKKFYGADVLEKPSVPVLMATSEQVTELKRLLNIVKIEEETTQKWLEKAGVDKYEEFTDDQILKCIELLKSKIKGE